MARKNYRPEDGCLRYKKTFNFPMVMLLLVVRCVVIVVGVLIVTEGALAFSFCTPPWLQTNTFVATMAVVAGIVSTTEALTIRVILMLDRTWCSYG